MIKLTNLSMVFIYMTRNVMILSKTKKELQILFLKYQGINVKFKTKKISYALHVKFQIKFNLATISVQDVIERA